ncbi:hypothetical protein [Microbacterium sp. XT11]|uniref:hypothetical protein n=1 Tax=Microbacterium sp. XT11 TaxID=367477 RepID=UPI00082B6011|nr:hypothetical protein [Microbacterium sp. XT11]
MTVGTYRRTAPPKGLGVVLAALTVLVFLLSLFIGFGVPLLLGLLIFPALGLTGPLLALAWVAIFLVWWAFLAFVRK